MARPFYQAHPNGARETRQGHQGGHHPRQTQVRHQLPQGHHRHHEGGRGPQGVQRDLRDHRGGLHHRHRDGRPVRSGMGRHRRRSRRGRQGPGVPHGRQLRDRGQEARRGVQGLRLRHRRGRHRRQPPRTRGAQLLQHLPRPRRGRLAGRFRTEGEQQHHPHDLGYPRGHQPRTPPQRRHPRDREERAGAGIHRHRGLREHPQGERGDDPPHGIPHLRRRVHGHRRHGSR